MSDDRTTEPPDELYALLPWYANGTLGPADRDRVERALADDGALSASLARIIEERHETMLLNEAIPAPRAGGIDVLLARIEADAPRRDRTARPGFLAGLLGASWGPRFVALAGVAAALVIIAESGALLDLMSRAPSDGPAYVIASIEPPNPADQSVLFVSFADGAGLGAVSKLLRANHATIIEGPLAGGLFRVAVPAAEADAVLSEFKAHPDLVRFAGLGK
jgi:hypothetical protein